MCVFHLSPSSLGRSEQEDDSSSQARVGLRDSVSVCWLCSPPHRISCLRMAGSYGLMSNFKCTYSAHNHTLFNLWSHLWKWNTRQMILPHAFTVWCSDLHHFGDIPDANLAPLGGSSQELRAAAEAVARDLVRTVRAVGKLGGAGRQCHWQRHVLRVLALHKWTIRWMSLVFGPGG